MIIASGSKLQIVIFCFAFLIYVNTIKHDYAWDDSIVITENPRVQKGIKGIPDLFIKYNSDYKADKYGYRPITLCSFAIEYGLFKTSPSVSHFMNVLYYAILCLVLFKVLQQLFYEYTSLPAFIITLFFIVHPLHVEVVANIKSRDEIFSLLFGLLYTSRMISYLKTKKTKDVLLSILYFLLAFLSKENAIVFIAVIPIVILYTKQWSNVKIVLKPLLVFCFLFIVAFFILKTSMESSLGKAQSQGAGIYYENGILGNCFFYTDIFITKLANAFCLLFMYLKNFLWPANLVYFYGYNQIPVASWSQPLVILSAVLHISGFVFAILNLKKHKEISLGVLFYLISISIYLHLMRPIADTMADRFMFTPLLGLLITFVFILSKVFKIDFKTFQISNFLKGSTHQSFKYIVIVLISVLSITTFSRNRVWKNNETLIKTDLPKLENCSRAHSYYADILKTKLQTNFDSNIEGEMIMHYKKSISISNEAYYAYLGLATYYLNTKRYDESIVLLDSMLTKYSNQADPNFYMGQALYYKQQYLKAINFLQKSLKLAPEVANTYFYLALTLSKCQRYNEAEKLISISKSKFGESASIYEVLGTIYFENGNIEQATKHTLKMINFGANPEMVYSIVIGRYQTLKDDKNAKLYYQQALQNGLFKNVK